MRLQPPFELDMDSDSEMDCAVETGGPPVVVRVVPELALDVGTKMAYL